MQNHIRNTNLRFNLDKDQQRRAWEYLQTMDRQNFKSYSQVISLALVDYFDRYYRTQADPYLETRERAVSYTHLRAHETGRNLVCRLLLEKKKKKTKKRKKKKMKAAEMKE